MLCLFSPGDANKATIIALSTASNIISKHTSMVGVDFHTKKTVTGELVQRRVPIMMNYLPQRVNISSFCWRRDVKTPELFFQ